MKWTLAKLLFAFCLGLLFAPAVPARVIPLRPGSAVTIDCVNVYTLGKRLPQTGGLTVKAQVILALDETGTVLTISLQNTSTAATEAALYALDLGLTADLVNAARMEASFSAFPAEVRWLGPTDVAAPTRATSTCVFGAREAVAGRMEEYLSREKTLPASFLQAGQSGRITVKMVLPPQPGNRPLLIDPVAYFLFPDPQSPEKRIQIASTRAN